MGIKDEMRESQQVKAKMQAAKDEAQQRAASEQNRLRGGAEQSDQQGQ
jgi:hypothetical protein